MYSCGYVLFDGIDCVYTEDKDGIRLIPTKEESIRKLSTHYNDHDFTFYYTDGVEKNCIAHIDRIEMDAGHFIRLIPNYVIKLSNASPISSMRITGASIDEIFHPAGYYYTKHEAGIENTVDLAYGIEVADKWEITVDGKTVEVSLLYGGILHQGIASDMMLHPQLHATFQPTADSKFLFKLYSTITRFLQLTQYNCNFGECKVYLRGTEPDLNSGYLFDWAHIGVNRLFYNEIAYRYIKPYIGSLLQFSADNACISFDFLPNAEYRWKRTDYTPQILTSLFAAFESEYKANKHIYETGPTEDYKTIKQDVIQKIQECSSSNLTDAERQFILQAKSSIQQLGTQTGQVKKIKNVLQTLGIALKTSAIHLFPRQRLGNEDGFTKEEITKIAKEIVGLRALVSHEYSLSSFTDNQAEYVHFLEILVHAQMLKRAGIDDTGIELIIGILFHCNFKYLEGILNKSQTDEETE